MAQNTLTICGVEYKLRFDKGGETAPPTLRLTTATASPLTYTGRLDCAGCNFATFAFYLPIICTGDRSADGPCYDTFRLDVYWDCCPLEGYTGAGWYCVVTRGEDCATAVAVELTDADKCRTDIDICSGPYATEADAKAVCGSASVPCSICPGGVVSSRLKITIAGSSNYDGAYVVTYTGTSGGACYWQGDQFDSTFGPRKWYLSHISPTSVIVTLDPQSGGTTPNPVQYTAALGAPWDCASLVTLTKNAQDNTECGGCTWPTTITVEAI